MKIIKNKWIKKSEGTTFKKDEKKKIEMSSTFRRCIDIDRPI